MRDGKLGQETATRLMRYSAAAGLGAFAFGQAASEALAEVVYVDLGGIVLQRGDMAEYDVDGDGYLDFRLVNTELGGIGGYGSVQLNTSADAAWYGTPAGSNPLFPNAGYSRVQVNMDAPSTKGTNAYYTRSFIDGGVIGPSNAQCWDETGTSFGRLYGLLSQYPGWNQNSFWNPAPSPWYPTYGYNYNEYAGLKIIDTNGDTRYAWIRFQVFLHDKANTTGFPFPDGKLTQHDLRWDDERYVVLYDYAYETTPNTDIIAGDMGATLEGDLDGDGFVGITDLNLVLGNWNQAVPPGDPLADPSGDNFVGIADLNTVLGNWNAGTPPTSAAVPEPGALGLLAAGAGALALGRGRRR